MWRSVHALMWRSVRAPLASASTYAYPWVPRPTGVLAFSAGPGCEPLLFTGRTPGTIVEPQGSGGFGWDAIFVPDGSSMPFGAMDLDAKNQISHRARAFAQFVAHCKANQAEMVEAIDSGALSR